MTSTLTDRYVQEVVRRIPSDQREDVAAELRTTIADTVQARVPEAESNRTDTAGTDVEREVLTEMGDPIRLAASYADRPLAVVGPTFYPTYVRLLRMLLTLVLPIVVIVAVALDVIENNSIGSAIAAAVTTTLVVAAQLFAWPTAIFALVERVVPPGGEPGKPQEWTPDLLPAAQEADDGRMDAAAGAVWNGLVLVALLWQQFASPYRPDGHPVPIMDPALWPGQIWPVLLGVIGLIAVHLVRIGTRRWTGPLVGALGGAHLLFALPLAYILYQGMFFDPEFLNSIEDGWTVPSAVTTLAAIGVVAVSGWDVIEHIRKLRR